jgi:hypothetical protein
MPRLAPLLLLCSLAACGAAARDVVEPGEVAEAGGAPSIERVVDLGDLPSIPARGPLPLTESDGRFTVGELVLVEGDDFGKLPTVAIGGRPARVLARTGGGGLVVRIPPEVPAGELAVEVSHPGGAGRRTVSVSRLALAIEPRSGVVQVVEVGAALRAAGSLRIAGARDAAIAPGGEAAYVTIDPAAPGAMAQLAVVSLAARGGPRLGKSYTLESARAEAIAVAREAAVGAVWGGGRLTLLDLGAPRSPDLLASVPLPGAVIALSLSPDGKRLAALTADGRLLPVHLDELSRPRFGDPLVLGQERAPLARDLGFAPGGDELWVLSGEGRESAASGRHPTRLTVVDWSGPAPTLGRSVELPLAGAPRHLALARREAVGAATAVRSTRRRVFAAVSALSPALLVEGARPAAVGDLGGVARVDLDGEAAALGAPAALYGALAMTPDGGRVLGTALLPRGDGTARFALVAIPAAGGEPELLELGDVARGDHLEPGGLAVAP